MSTAINPPGITRMRTAQPAGRAPASSTGRPGLPPPAKLSEKAALQDRADDAQFEKQAAEYANPTTSRPVLIIAEEIARIRRDYDLGGARLGVLRQVVDVRLAVWLERNDQVPFDVPSPANRAKAEAFFAAHGTRLADAPRRAPDNPLKAREAEDAARAHAARQAELAEARKQALAKVASPAKDRPPVPHGGEKPATPATPAAAAESTHEQEGGRTPAPVRAGDGSAQTLALLNQIAKAGQAHAAQLTALANEIKALREQLANQPAAAADAEMEFVMDTIAVGLDDKTFETTYKARGPQFKTHGVRVWPEILPELGLDEAKLKPGLHKLPKPLKVRALLAMGEDGQLHPKKVLGLAAK